MPHQCVRCGKIYVDASNEILRGCGSCGGRFFFFVREEQLNKLKEASANLNSDDRLKIESDVKDVVGEYLQDDKPVILDFAAVNVIGPGKFELDLVKLFKGEPVVYRLEEGKYVIDIVSTFKNLMHKKKRTK
jgi:predicted  nucleic acid-binding Zn-ribbon protein